MTRPFRSPSTRHTRSRIPARRLVLLLASLAIVLISPISASSSRRLYVFVNADMRAHALENELESHLSGVDVTVFGRIRGLQAALAENPDGVLARSPVLEALGLRPELQGYVGSSSSEPFVLLSVNDSVSPNELDGEMVGAVNILGRNQMQRFINDLLGGASPRLKYVTHERDLLALLQFGAVKAVVTSERWAGRFRSMSEMNLKITALDQQVGLPAVSFGSSGGRATLEGAIKGAGSQFNNALGVSRWR